MLTTGHCTICGAAFAPATLGRPRMYCSEACRKRAGRARHAAVSPDAKPSDSLRIDARDVLGPSTRDPDEAVVECIVYARSAAAMFGVSAEHARPALAWRCEAMADYIAAGLRKYFGAVAAAGVTDAAPTE